MFENFVLDKIQKENDIIGKLLEASSIEGIITKPDIINSSLSDFTKNFLLNEISDKINADEFEIRIEKSNKLYFNYVIRPKWTLITFLFNNFESRPPSDIIKKLKLFPFYAYYIDAINNFIKDNFQIFVTRGEITSIIDGTNKAIYQKLTNDINNIKIKNLFLQIFKLKYAEEGNINLESTVPYSFIKIFLEDKSFSDFEKKFGVVNSISDELEISLKDIIKVLTDKYNVIEKENAVTDRKDIPLNTEPKRIVLHTQVQNSSVRKEEIKPEEIKKSDSTKNKPLEKIYSEQLMKANQTVTETVRQTKTEDRQVNVRYNVKDLFNERQMERISEKVYSSDLVYREKSFDKLSHYKTWFEASNHLKEIFKLNNVDMFNKDVITFVDILNDYYQNRE